MLLGSGELGKEFTIAAKRAGLYVVACDKYPFAPAMQVADTCEIFNMLDGATLAQVVDKHKPDIIVPEIEAIRTEKLFDFEKQGIQVVPSARAANFTMNRKAIRDLASRELGIRTAKYHYAKTFSEFKVATEDIGFPCVVKPLMSSSGHGQSYVHNEAELEQAFHDAMEEGRGDVKEVIIEEFIDFDSEFTLLTVTQKHGQTLFCPPIGHTQQGGDYRESWQPYAIDACALKQAEAMAGKVTEALTGYGTNLSQFELHLRATMGWPIPAIHLEHCGCSAVVLAKETTDSAPEYHIDTALSEDRTRVRIFGKPTQHIGRRMGIVLCYDEVGSDIDALRSKAKRLAQTIIP